MRIATNRQQLGSRFDGGKDTKKTYKQGAGYLKKGPKSKKGRGK